MSDSVRPHRQQPTRLPRPWDSPGKNTGVGCRFLLQCMKVKSESEVAQSCLTPSDPMGHWSGCHCLLQISYTSVTKNNCVHLLNIKEIESWMTGFGESLAANLSPTRPPCGPVTKGLMSGTARGFRTQLQPADCGALCTISVNLHRCFLHCPSYPRFFDEKSKI